VESDLISSRTVLAENGSITGNLFVDGGDVYWTELDQPEIGSAAFRLRRSTERSARPTTVAGDTFVFGSEISAITGDANSVYVAVVPRSSSNRYSIRAYDRATGVGRNLGQAGGFPTSIAVRGDALVLAVARDGSRFARASRIDRVALDGSGASTLLPGAGEVITSLAVDTSDINRLYWTDDGRNGGESQTGKVFSVRLPDGAKTLIADSRQFPLAALFPSVTQDAKNVYFAAGVYAGAIGVWPKDGSAAARELVTLGEGAILNGTPSSAVVDGSNVFFVASRKQFRFGGDVLLRSSLAGAGVVKLDDSDIDGSDPGALDPQITKRASFSPLQQNDKAVFFTAITYRGSSVKEARVVRILKPR